MKILHCLKNLDIALSVLERQSNSRVFYVYNIDDLDNVGKIFEIKEFPDEEFSVMTSF